MEDAAELRKLCLALSINLNSGLDKFLEMSVFDLIDVCEDYKELMKDVRTRERKFR